MKFSLLEDLARVKVVAVEAYRTTVQSVISRNNKKFNFYFKRAIATSPVSAGQHGQTPSSLTDVSSSP